MWLYSVFDRVVQHRRRYTRGRLKRLLEGAGFRVVKCTYLFSLLLPVVAVHRFVEPFSLRLFSDGKRVEEKVSIVPRVPALVNRVATMVFAVEGRVAEFMGLPFGTSVVGVGLKRA